MPVELPPTFPGPDDADTNTAGVCQYEDCDSKAEYRALMKDVWFELCGECDRKHKIHAQDLVEDNAEITHE